ncbi:related to pectate lyase [Rhynchosporium graminicola]|uniref:Pectate lyase n=1 Tax=Rhynchosporium graminicola TaxID=2792576 RepID=A0A1E1KR86_9HELO|nr:related to pectate lyase [Rhynchosporium commune]
MRLSIIQIFALILALGVSAAPPQDNKPSTDTSMRNSKTGNGGSGKGKGSSSGSTSPSKDHKPKDNSKGNGNTANGGSGGGSGGGKGSSSGSTAPPKNHNPGHGVSKGNGTTTSGGSAPNAPMTTPGRSMGNGTATTGGKVPKSAGTSILKAAQTIAAGASFDGKLIMYDRGTPCTGQQERGDEAAVFQIEHGGSISNVIIGPNQSEGIHCQGACTLTNVWWPEVCEDAFTIKNQAAGETTRIIGGGAFNAQDKVLQHNGGGTLDVSNFTVIGFGKLYRACGNCAQSTNRHVKMSNIMATNGEILAGVNGNFGDTAIIKNSRVHNVSSICTNFKGVTKGTEPSIVSSGADGKVCIYGSDVISQ